jgi:hypothetical protein
MGFDRVGGNTAPFCAMVTINGSTPTTTNLSSASIDNNWHHYACSYERTTNTVAFYIDSQLISTNTLTLSNGAKFPVITQPMYVGYNPNTVQSFSPGGLTGVIDDFMMSDSALSVYAIAQMYNNTNPASPLVKELLLCRRELARRRWLVPILDFQQSRLTPKPHQQVRYSLALTDDPDSRPSLAQCGNDVVLIGVNLICSSHGCYYITTVDRCKLT